MKNVIVSNVVSLDGFMADTEGEIDCLTGFADKESVSYMVELIRSVDTLLFGRVTYERMEEYWPAVRPDAEDPRIIDAMNSHAKIVFSSTLKKAGWNNTQLFTGDAAEAVAELKKRQGKDMVIFGSGKLVSSLAPLGLIDDLRIFVAPVILGNGKSLFRGVRKRLEMKITETRTFGTGMILLRFKPDCCELRKNDTGINRKLVARVSIAMSSPAWRIWEALLDPVAIKRYMFGTSIVTDWRQGSPVVWSGEREGRRYEDKGRIVRVEKERFLQYTHFSPRNGKLDIPENYRVISIELSGDEVQTIVTLSQDNNETEAERGHSEKEWRTVLEELRRLVEK